MNFQLKLNIEKLQGLNGQLEYANMRLNQPDIKEWEIKDFTEIKCIVIKEILEIKELIERIKSLEEWESF